MKVDLIPRWNIYSRLQYLEDSQFTKEDAVVMAKDLKDENAKMAKELKAETVATEKRTMLFSLLTLGISQIIPILMYSKSNPP